MPPGAGHNEQIDFWKCKRLLPCLIDGELGGSTAPHNGQDIAAKQHLHNADATILELPPKLQHEPTSTRAPAFSKCQDSSLPHAACSEQSIAASNWKLKHHYCMRGQLTVSLNGSQLYTLKPADSAA